MSKQEAEVAFSAGNAAFVDEEYTLAIEVSSYSISSVNSIPASVSILPVTGDGFRWECDVCDVSSRPVEVLTVQLTSTWSVLLFTGRRHSHFLSSSECG
jgi:hypothetical protein